MKNFMWSVTEIYAVGSLSTFFFILSMWILLLCIWDLIAFECVLWPARLCLKRTHGETPSCADSAHVQLTAVAMATSGTLWSHFFFFSLLDEINKASSLWLCDCMCTRALERVCVSVCVPERKKKKTVPEFIVAEWKKLSPGDLF